MNPNIQFPEQVILLDAAFLQDTLHSIHRIMSERLGRTLPPLDLPTWLTCLLLDAGVRNTDNEVQVLVADESKHRTTWTTCQPDHPEAIDGKACHTALGELAFSVVSGESLTDAHSLYRDLMRLVLNDHGVKKMLLIPNTTNNELQATLQQLQKELGTWNANLYGCFLDTSSHTPLYEQLPLVYSLAHAWGIRAEELT